MQPREGTGLQRLRQQTIYFGEAPSSGGPLRRQAREWQETEEQRLSDTQVKNVLHRVTHGQKNRQLGETKEELERIKCRVDATVEAYEESSRQVFDSYKSRTSMTFLEDLDQLEGLLSNVLDRKRYEQQVTVFIVGFQETCDQQEQVLTQLQEVNPPLAFHNCHFFTHQVTFVINVILHQVQEALLSAENATQRMLELSKEMMSYLSILDSKGTKKGRKRIEKSLNQAKDDVNQLTEKLLAAYKGMEQNDENLKALLKQNEIKTLESQHFRTHAAATKRMLETFQQDWEVQRTLLQRQVATAAARAQETEEAHRQAIAQVESLTRLAEEQAKQLEPEEKTPDRKSSEKSSPRGDSRLPAESPKSPLCDISPSLGSPASTTSVAPRRGGTHGRPGEAAVSPRCGSEPSGSPTSHGAVGARSEEGSQSERSNPSPVAEERLPEEATRLADDPKDWERHSLKEKVNQMVQLQKFAQKDFQRSAENSQGSVNVTEDGLKITSSLEMISSFGSTQRVFRSTSVFGDSSDENSVKQFPVSNVKVVYPALGIEEPQSSEGFLQERVHFLEQKLEGKQLELDEERERNLKLVAELRKQIRALQRSALGDNACSPEDPTSTQIFESIVFFTRTDMEHNVRKLRRGFYNEKVQRGHCEDAMSAMEKIVAAQRKRLVMMTERYVEHVNMKRIRDNVSRNYSDSPPVCELLGRMETLQSKSHQMAAVHSDE
ncbi:unnamed protein product [Lampetra planeri]